jgi:7-carboxy-7-deazaguanine synthase
MNTEEKYLLISDDGPGFYTLEGEGEYIGQPSVFMRLFGCNLTCKAFASADSPHGCDSYISWSKKFKYTFDEMFKFYEDNGFVEKLQNRAIWKITGGEPMLRQTPLLNFVEEFTKRYGFLPRIDFETNATIKPEERWLTQFNATFTTSPKLTSNGDPEERTYVPEVLRWHSMHNSGFKFVVNTSDDLIEIWRKYIDDYNGINVPLQRVWLMPCCGSRSEHIERASAIAEFAKQCGVNFSPRLHLLLWDKALRV